MSPSIHIPRRAASYVKTPMKPGNLSKDFMHEVSTVAAHGPHLLPFLLSGCAGSCISVEHAYTKIPRHLSLLTGFEDASIRYSSKAFLQLHGVCVSSLAFITTSFGANYIDTRALPQKSCRGWRAPVVLTWHHVRYWERERRREAQRSVPEKPRRLSKTHRAATQKARKKNKEKARKKKRRARFGGAIGEKAGKAQSKRMNSVQRSVNERDSSGGN